MKFTDSEMLFLNSIQDGQPIFGLELQKPLFTDKKYIEKTIAGLAEKGFIDGDGILKDEILEPAMALELYKKADTYVFINNMRAAFYNEKKIAAIIKDDDSYEFLTCETWEFLYLLISNSKVLNEHLSNSDMPFGEPFEAADMVRDIRDGQYEDGAIIQKYTEGKMVKEFIFYWNDTYTDLYDGIKRTRKRINGQQARLLLFELFDISLEGGTGSGFSE